MTYKKKKKRKSKPETVEIQTHIRKKKRLSKVQVPISKANMNSNSTISDAQVLQALIKTRGLPARAARLLNTTYAKIIERLNKNPKIFEEYKTFEQEMVDLAIAQSEKEIETGNTQIILHFLKTLGRERGHGEQKTITVEGNPDKPIKFELNLIGLDKDELLQLSNLLKKAIQTYENRDMINPFTAEKGTYLKNQVIATRYSEDLRRCRIMINEENEVQTEINNIPVEVDKIDD